MRWAKVAATIFPPTDERDPAAWASTFAGHVSVGAVLAVITAWLLGWPVWAAPLAYGLAWETAWQRLGAGLWDAVVDTWAVTVGAVMIWAAWHNLGPVLAADIVLGLASVWAGIRRRL